MRVPTAVYNPLDIGEEDKVGFHEYVFLDHLIKDFPSKGPIRHFMDKHIF